MLSPGYSPRNTGSGEDQRASNWIRDLIQQVFIVALDLMYGSGYLSDQEGGVSSKILERLFNIRCARVAELADASDSKSEAFYEAWGFESPLWHPSYPIKGR